MIITANPAWGKIEEVKRKWGRIPITPAPTPVGEKGPYEVYGRNQRCLQAKPVSSFITLRLEEKEEVAVEAHAALPSDDDDDGAHPLSDDVALWANAPADPIDDCYRQCHFVAGLDPVYYFSVDNAGLCYCCKEWCVVYMGWVGGSRPGVRLPLAVDNHAPLHFPVQLARVRPGLHHVRGSGDAGSFHAVADTEPLRPPNGHAQRDAHGTSDHRALKAALRGPIKGTDGAPDKRAQHGADFGTVN